MFLYYQMDIVVEAH